jgi:uncharacterized membrane protein
MRGRLCPYFDGRIAISSLKAAPAACVAAPLLGTHVAKFLSHLSQHRWFYIALALGTIAGLAAMSVDPALAIPVGGDMFYATYLILIAGMAKHLTAARLRTRAAADDEGIVLIAVITVVALIFSLVSIFSLLNTHPTPDLTHLVLALSAAPLAWFVLHTNAAFHYAHYYYGDPDGAGGKPQRGGLRFPGRGEPGIGDFIYFAFIIGMTAQTADIDIESTGIRRRATGHGIISFVFNTVLIAMAVNVVVSLIQAH